MDSATSHRPDGPRPQHGRGWTSRRRLVAATAMAAGIALAPTGTATAAECTGATLLQRLLCAGSAPAPTTSTTAPPVTVPPVTVPTLPPVTVAPAPSAPRVVPDAGRRLLDLANAERRHVGLPPLAWREDAADIALAHSQRMAASGELFHNDAYFGSATRRLLNASALGENVAYNGSVDEAHRRLMASPGHRANLLDRRFSAVGMGVVLAPDGRYFITQDFLQAAGAAPAARPAAARAAASPRPAARRAAAAVAPPTVPTTTTPPSTTAPVTAPAPAPAPVDVAAALETPGPLAAAQVPSPSPSRHSAAVAALAVALIALGAPGWWALRRRRWS